MTKVVTGLLLALAIEEREVSGSDRLERFLPGTGAAGGAPLAELATHTSGLPRLPAATLLRALAHSRDPYRGTTLRRLIRDTRRVHLDRPGGAAYSNLGVALLGHALAAAAALPYWDLARRRVLLPLGMASSGNLPPSALAVPAGAWDLGAFAPAGGLRATVEDLLLLAWVAARPDESPFPAAATAARCTTVIFPVGSFAPGLSCESFGSCQLVIVPKKIPASDSADNCKGFCRLSRL